jgi:superfamily II DNA or RNA helicase
MTLPELVETLRDEVDERIWTHAVQLARDGAVEGRMADDAEWVLSVKARGRPTPFEVYLWPADPDWGCDCGLPLPCVHVCAAAIAAARGVKMGAPLPVADAKYRVRLRYDFRTEGARLALGRTVVWPDGRAEPWRGTLSEGTYQAERWDVTVEARLALHRGGPLDASLLAQILVDLEGRADATLDGAPVRLSSVPVALLVRVLDDGDGFRVGLYRPPGLSAMYHGAAVKDGVLHPVATPPLSATERAALDARGDAGRYRRDQGAWIATRYVPFLRGKGLEVRVETTRLPHAADLVPHVVLDVREEPDGVVLAPALVYGEPPVLVVRSGQVERHGDVVVVRDEGAERQLARSFFERTGLVVGEARLWSPAEAEEILLHKLPSTGVAPRGSVRTRIAPGVLVPQVVANEVDGGWSLTVSFRLGEATASATDALRAAARAERIGRGATPLVRLSDGTWGALPAGWMEEHGALLRSLIEAQQEGGGRLPAAAIHDVAALSADAVAVLPEAARRLRDRVARGAELPPLVLPDDLRATLRPYQEDGVRWLAFLHDIGLGGVLADDMGLGKTLQTLCALGVRSGPHLVVAPTSVLGNWVAEAARFLPGRRVCAFHGAGRVLDEDAWLVVTSYALLRADDFPDRTWDTVVLDEAQAIKNPSSQTATAARRLNAAHRLALSGTPVENRLDELWSLFAFVAPGLLGRRLAEFRERFETPILAGRAAVRDALTARIRPFLLRRMKRDVAKDLPSLTEIVQRVPMGPEQRKVYEAVRLRARSDVQDAILGGRATRSFAVLEALLRLRQAACDPSLVPGVDVAAAAKLDRLEELVVELVPAGHKLLVFSQWTSLLDRVARRLDGLGVAWARLDGATRDRDAAVASFQRADGPPVFLLSLKAGGTGLNLTAADYVVHLDPWWNPAAERQATDRAWRIGQERPVVALRLVAEGTVEERVLALQEAKKDLASLASGEDDWVRLVKSDELLALLDPVGA